MKRLAMLRYWFWRFKHRPRWTPLSELVQPPWMEDDEREWYLVTRYGTLCLAYCRWNQGVPMMSEVMQIRELHPQYSNEIMAKRLEL